MRLAPRVSINCLELRASAQSRFGGLRARAEVLLAGSARPSHDTPFPGAKRPMCSRRPYCGAAATTAWTPARCGDAGHREEAGRASWGRASHQTMILLLLALASAVGTNFLFEHRGAVLARRYGFTPVAERDRSSPPDGSRSGGWSRSWLGACTSARSRSRPCRSCRPSSPADSCSSPCSPCGTSAPALGVRSLV